MPPAYINEYHIDREVIDYIKMIIVVSKRCCLFKNGGALATARVFLLYKGTVFYCDLAKSSVNTL